MDIKLLDILNKVIKEKSIKKISEDLNLSVGTLKRWLDKKSVPIAYQFDILKIANIEIDYSQFSKNDKDQFFTSEETAKYCYKVFVEKLKELGDNNNYTFIEPSAGSGSFLNVLPKDKTIAFDIEPLGENIIEQDYLDWYPTENKKYVVFGNPPFGLRGHLALKFINHSSNFADYVCFILPQLFESDGKGVPSKRIKDYNLIHSEKINNDFSYPDGKKVKVNCVFQILSKYNTSEKYKKKCEINPNIKIYSLSDGGTPSTTRNKKMFSKCDVYLPSTCFGKENMRWYSSFYDLPNKRGYGIVFEKDKEENLIKFKQIKWYDVAFLSTNSAYNIRTTLISSLL
jgi:hypothetical protein